jgi:hypothetical protein
MTPITTCPHCSALVEGSCVRCPEGSNHPSCKNCQGGVHKPPWYTNDKVQTALAIASASVVSALILATLRRKYGID